MQRIGICKVVDEMSGPGKKADVFLSRDPRANTLRASGCHSSLCPAFVAEQSKIFERRSIGHQEQVCIAMQGGMAGP